MLHPRMTKLEKKINKEFLTHQVRNISPAENGETPAQQTRRAIEASAVLPSVSPCWSLTSQRRLTLVTYFQSVKEDASRHLVPAQVRG